MALTTDRFVLPLTFEAVKEIRTDHGAVMHEASQEATIMPHPAVSDNFSKQMHPISGGTMRAKAMNVLFRGNSTHPPTPIQSIAICTAPDGAVYSIVSNLV